MSKKKKAPKMGKASKEPISNIDMIADKVLGKILDHMSEEITKPVSGRNPFTLC